MPVSFSQKELDALPRLGTEVKCPHCGGTHPVCFGTVAGTDLKSDLAFYKCGTGVYLCGMCGKAIEPGAAAPGTRMYILVKSSLEPGMAACAAAHASLACYLKFKDTPAMRDWLDHSFKKVVCLVNESEFTGAKAFKDHVLMTESTLGDFETALAFCPRPDWPKPFKFYKLWR